MEAEPESDAVKLGERLAAHFQEVYIRAMADVPICNPALEVAATGFRVWQGQAIGIVTTPWFMNIVLAPLKTAPEKREGCSDANGLATEGAGAPRGRSGDTVSVSLPAARIDFLVADLTGFGRLLMCSLFSPMESFQDQAAALATAEAAMDHLFDPQLLADAPEPEVYPTAIPAAPAVEAAETPSLAPPETDRRALLRGGSRSQTRVATG